MKRWTPAEVVWEDSHGGDDGWLKLSAKDRKPFKVRSVGLVDSDTKKGITLIMSLNTVNRDSAGYIFISRACILEVKRLR